MRSTKGLLFSFCEGLVSHCLSGYSLNPPLAPAPRAPLSRRNVAVLSHAEYVPTLTAAAASALRPRQVRRPGDLDL